MTFSITKQVSKQLLKCIKSKADDMEKSVVMLAQMNSGSHHLQGLAHMHDALMRLFKPLADEVQTHPLPPVANINLQGQEGHDTLGALLFFRKRPHLKRRILLCGHMDTVFSKHHPFQSVSYPEPGILKGPGVTDMKGGLIVLREAIRAFETLEISKTMGWDIAINADEEIGSLASRAFLNHIRADYGAALVYEPAMSPKGEFARSRKGSGKFTLVAKGKPAHAGRAFHKGRNAIAYLSEIMVALHALNQNERNVTFNIGKMAGGDALNVVAETAVAKIDVRTCSNEDETWVMEQLNALIETYKRRGYHLKLHGHFGRPAKTVNTATKALFKRIQSLGQTYLNAKYEWHDTGGVCDGNNLAELGLAVIDTMGVRGANIHSPEEFLVLESLVERAHLSALLYADLAAGALEAL